MTNPTQEAIPAEQLERINIAADQDCLERKYGVFAKKVARGAFIRGAKAEYLRARQHNKAPFGLSEDDVKTLLERGLKPEEIGGDPEKQHDRVEELIRWFARFAKGHANIKWFQAHAFELAYYIATNSCNRPIDVDTITLNAYEEGRQQAHGETVKRIVPEKPYFVGECESCGFKAASSEWGGCHQIADTGDYSDPVCPVCGSYELGEADDDVYIDQKELFIKKIDELNEIISDLSSRAQYSSDGPDAHEGGDSLEEGLQLARDAGMSQSDWDKQRNKSTTEDIPVPEEIVKNSFSNSIENMDADSKIFVDKSLAILDRITKLLKNKGLKQKDLADLLSKSEPEISKWLAGMHNYTLRTISKLEAVIGENIILVPVEGLNNVEEFLIKYESMGRVIQKVMKEADEAKIKLSAKEQELCILKEELASAQFERNTSQLQLAAKEQECEDYRKALEEIKNGKSSLHHTYENQLTATDMALAAHHILNKYPSPPTK